MIYREPDGPVSRSRRGRRDCVICGERTGVNARFCGFCEQQLAEEEAAELRDWKSREEVKRRT